MPVNIDDWLVPGKQCDAFAKVMHVPNDPEHPDYKEALRKTRFPFSSETAAFASKIVCLNDGLTGDYYTSEPELAA